MKGLMNVRIGVGGTQGTCKTDRLKWVAREVASGAGRPW